MIARIQHIDILDLPADALIYSTNVFLNCSGGIGSCLVERYGKVVQDDMHSLLSDQGIKFADQGSVFQHVSKGMPYHKVFHTLPCDGFYETSEEIIENILHSCLQECVRSSQIRTVAISALGTGYGLFEFDAFFRVAAKVLNKDCYKKLKAATICIEDEYFFSLASEQIKKESLQLLVK